jgi:glutathione S-transferase
MRTHLRLISHKLCPYVQRAVIVASEKEISFERVDIDLANKPDWFLAISPTGKVPVLEVEGADARGHILFESAVIAEYLDEIGKGERLLPADPLDRARERAWVEYGAQALADIYRFYASPDEAGHRAARTDIEAKLERLEEEVAGPWFSGDKFGLVDAAFGPVFRYFDVFERHSGLNLLERLPKTRAWANALLKRPSVTGAVGSDYAHRLVDFIRSKGSFFARQLDSQVLQAA